MNVPLRHFLPWNRPLPSQAAELLARGWAGGGALDLSRVLVVVQTKQVGRRLRAALADLAAARGQAVFPPRVLTPEALVAPEPGPGTATSLESLLAWAEVLGGAEAKMFTEVFPAGVPTAGSAPTLRLARQFTRLQGTLAEAGLRLADVPGRTDGDFPEAGRWRQLAQLEARYDAALAARGRRDAQAVKIAATQRGALMAKFDRVVLLGTPDPLPLAVGALAGGAAVEVVIFAPPEEAGAFDEWGRPLAAEWEQRALALPEFEQRVGLCADPAAQAERVATLARDHDGPDGLLAIGVADAEVLPAIEGALGRAGVAKFNPEGQPRRGGALHQLLTVLARGTDFEAVEALARCPDVLAWLGARLGAEFSAARFLQELDELRARHLPADLAAARGHADSPALALLAELHATLKAEAFPASAAAALSDIFGARRLDLSHEADGRLAEAARAWTEVMRECAAARELFPRPDDAAWWELALEIFGDSKDAEDKPAGALELQGWLELLWEDAPHLVVAGLNDGRVPEAVTGDAFLPESLRAKLGLKTNAARLARDAYLLHALAASRPRLDVLFSKTSAAGEPLRPSRLLLRCADAELPARVAWLFREPELAQANPPWRRAWRLTPRRVAPPRKISVTALKSWLACPFRFYLRHVLEMQAVDAAKNELNAFDFGNLCHGALEAMGRTAALRDCTDAAALREFLLGELDRRAAERFGRELTLPLIVQVESARQRLARAAEVQARTRAKGWVTLDVEKKFELSFAGLAVRGKIDRIDRHETTGAVRVIDYKTSDTAIAPTEAHLRSLGRTETPPAWLVAEVGGKARAWQDLQLPLYRHALAAKFGADVTCEYFNLPKAVGETGLVPWENFSATLQAAALGAAEAVCTAIRAGEFWPPAELPGHDAERDEFAALFQRGAVESVEAEFWSQEPETRSRKPEIGGPEAEGGGA